MVVVLVVMVVVERLWYGSVLGEEEGQCLLQDLRIKATDSSINSLGMGKEGLGEQERERQAGGRSLYVSHRRCLSFSLSYTTRGRPPLLVDARYWEAASLARPGAQSQCTKEERRSRADRDHVSCTAKEKGGDHQPLFTSRYHNCIMLGNRKRAERYKGAFSSTPTSLLRLLSILRTERHEGVTCPF
jgi:hypothetical protein